LVEILVVIAVIAILAAVAIPTIRYTMDRAAESTDRRNAQHFSEMSSAVRSAGYPGWPTKSEAISALVAGINVTNPADPSLVIRFRLETMTPENQAKAAAYLASDGASLIYIPSGGQPTNLQTP